MIVRNGGQLSQLQRYLAGQGIPVRIPVAESAVRDEVAVRPLLDAYAVALDPDVLTPEAAVALLTSRIGGATAIELRRLRQSLRREELLGGGGRTSDVLLVEALLEPGALATLGIEGHSARRIARMIQAGRDAAQAPGGNAETVLWALWNSTGLAARWTEAALAGGAAGARADRDLDAMMALFHTAERFVDQLPGSGPEQFLEYLLSQELPMDTLAARAQLEDAVELMTPASAAGREWPVVIVPGLQEGVWPNTRLRGELLGSTLFADAVEHGVEYALQLDPLSRLREIRYDELRSFSTAVSRAQQVLICTAVSSEDEQPSSFLDYVAPLGPGQDRRGLHPGGASAHPARPGRRTAPVRPARRRNPRSRWRPAPCSAPWPPPSRPCPARTPRAGGALRRCPPRSPSFRRAAPSTSRRRRWKPCRNRRWTGSSRPPAARPPPTSPAAWAPWSTPSRRTCRTPPAANTWPNWSAAGRRSG